MAFIPCIRYLEYIYHFIYFPFALSSPFTRRCGGCADRAKLHRSASRHSRAARESGRTFKVGLLPPHPLNGWSTLLGLPSGRKGCPFPQKPDCYPTSPRTMLPSRFCHMVDDHSQKKLHPLSPAPSIVSLQKADRGSRREVATQGSPWSLCCGWVVLLFPYRVTHILILLLPYIYILLLLYCSILLLWYLCIAIYTYWVIAVFVYSVIVRHIYCLQ